MFGGYPGGEIIFASIPKDITGAGGDNEITIISPGRPVVADGNQELQFTDGNLSIEANSGDSSIEASGGETLG